MKKETQRTEKGAERPAPHTVPENRTKKSGNLPDHAAYPPVQSLSPGIILVSTYKGIELVRIDNIKRLSAERAYTRFHLTDGICLLASHNIGAYERILCGNSNCFFRLHESHIVNVRFICRFLFEDGGTLQMDDDTKIPVAKRRKKAFLEWLQKTCK